MNQVFLDNRFVREDKALLHFKDLTFLRGYGVFDFFRLQANTPLFIDDHLQRFYASARQMRLPVSHKPEELKDIIYTLIQKNNRPGTGIRLSLSGGYSEDGFSIGQPSLIVSQHGFAPPAQEQLNKGTRLISYPFQRQLPQVKTTDYLTAIWLQPLLGQNGADDILYHRDGFVSECPRSNFFLVMKDDTLVTPTENVLAGITAKKLMEAAEREFRVETRPVPLQEIGEAKEAFVTSTTKRILPVASIDDKIFVKHTVSRRLAELFRSACDMAE